MRSFVGVIVCLPIFFRKSAVFLTFKVLLCPQRLRSEALVDKERAVKVARAEAAQHLKVLGRGEAKGRGESAHSWEMEGGKKISKRIRNFGGSLNLMLALCIF